MTTQSYCTFNPSITSCCKTTTLLTPRSSRKFPSFVFRNLSSRFGPTSFGKLQKNGKNFAVEASKSKEDNRGISLPQAPSLIENSTEEIEVQKPPLLKKAPKLPSNIFSTAWRKLLRSLSSLPLAIAVMFGLAIFSGIGTVIEQGEPLSAYMKYYPEDNPPFGFLTWRVLLGLSLDHIYSSWYFLGLIALLAACLTACTQTRQWPVVKVAQRWSFLKSSSAVKKLEFNKALENAKIVDLATLLSADGFQVFLKDSTSLYAFKGLVGRFAPIGVHVALLLVIGGGLYTAIGGYRGSAVLPEGSEVFLGDAFVPNGILSRPSKEFNLRLNLKDFRIDYREDGTVKQFFSDLSLVDLSNREVYAQTVNVNIPLRYNGVTIYQTDWAVSSAQVKVEGEENAVLLPMASLTDADSDQKLFGTFLPLGGEGVEARKGISILASDLQTVVFYDSEGKFVGVRRPGSGKPITVDGVTLVAENLVGSSGLQIKMDPSIPYVYTGFGLLMLTSSISYLSHSQVWAIQEGGTVFLGGKSNRAKLNFEKELVELLDYVPEERDHA